MNVRPLKTFTIRETSSRSVGSSTVPIGHEDVAIGRGDDIAGLVELIWPGPRDAGGSEPHQDLAVRLSLMTR